ncbi:MAG: SDR family oxidoreductase [Alphaproteobacteria bacterium]|nr:SDR family oxidoreductase [Alphaproteobacteria bacterium]
MNKHLFCFGYGYCGEYLTRELLKEGGWTISGTTRDQEKRQDLRAKGIKVHIFDFDTPIPDPLYVLSDVTHLLLSIPPDDEGDPCYNQYLQEIISLQNLEWVGYLSTTGAYGDRDGGWVDEKSEARPTTKRGSRRWKAEQKWLSLFKTHKIPVHIFRLAGIYGPGRSALDSIRAGIARRIDKPGHAFSRIHVEDIVQVLKKSIENPRGGEIYNLSDDMPAPSHEVIEYACQLLGMKVPPLIPIEDADLAPITLSFYKDNKRIKNDKIKTELGVKLKHPDYKEGLRACLAAENGEIMTESNVS